MSGFKKSKVIVVSFGHFAHDIYSSFIAPLLPILVKNLSLNHTQAGFLSVAFRLPALISPLLGLIADKVNLKVFVIIGPFITAFLMCLVGYAGNYIALVTLLIFCGVNVMLFHIPSPVMIKHLSGSKTALGMSYYMIGGELARFIGPMLFVLGFTLWGLEGLYKLVPLAVFASIFLYIKLKNETIQKEMCQKSKKIRAHHTLKNKLPLLMSIAGIYLFNGIGKVGVTLFLPSYFVNRGFSLAQGGTALALIQFFGVIGVFGAGSIAGKLSARFILISTTIISSIFIFLLSISTGVISFVSLIMLGLTIFANGPILLSIINNSSNENTAFINSIFMALNLGIGSVSSIFVGMSIDSFGFSRTYKTAAVLNIFAIIFIFMIRESKSAKS